MLNKVVKFVANHKEQFIRGGLTLVGGLIGIVGMVIAVKSNEMDEPNPGEGDPYSEPPLVEDTTTENPAI
jgi:hypothetical protein